MVDHFQVIYRQHADRYEALIAREDYQGRLLPAIQALVSLEGARVVEMGVGTGRLTRLLAPAARSIQGFDASRHMLAEAARQLRRSGCRNVALTVADNRHLPVAGRWADLAVEGWSFGHLTGWHPGAWHAEVARAVDEMLRVVRPGGTAIILETLGTGREDPYPPSTALAEFYAYLEHQRGFTRTWLRTDYLFESLSEAEALVRFFFGAELAQRVVQENWVALPECTGLWWRGVA
jgi:ubiquinone/menaquinone biosynthesis C-methylase UbiE